MLPINQSFNLSLQIPARVKLLVHIIQQLLPIGITADRLQQVANDIRRQIKPPEKVEILDELFRVRRLEEKFQQKKVGMYNLLKTTLTLLV